MEQLGSLGLTPVLSWRVVYFYVNFDTIDMLKFHCRPDSFKIDTTGRACLSFIINISCWLGKLCLGALYTQIELCFIRKSKYVDFVSENTTKNSTISFSQKVINEKDICFMSFGKLSVVFLSKFGKACLPFQELNPQIQLLLMQLRARWNVKVVRSTFEDKSECTVNSPQLGFIFHHKWVFSEYLKYR